MATRLLVMSELNPLNLNSVKTINIVWNYFNQLLHWIGNQATCNALTFQSFVAWLHSRQSRHQVFFTRDNMLHKPLRKTLLRIPSNSKASMAPSAPARVKKWALPSSGITSYRKNIIQPSNQQWCEYKSCSVQKVEILKMMMECGTIKEWFQKEVFFLIIIVTLNNYIIIKQQKSSPCHTWLWNIRWNQLHLVINQKLIYWMDKECVQFSQYKNKN